LEGILFLPAFALAVFIAIQIARRVHARTGSRHWAAVAFAFGLTIPWADAWIGVPYFYYWQRSHTSGAIYDRVEVNGYLRDTSGSPYHILPRPNAPYQYVEFPRGRLAFLTPMPVAGRYLAASVVEAPNAQCIESTEAVGYALSDAGWAAEGNRYCLRLVGADRPVSRYALIREEFLDREELRVWWTRDMGWYRANDGLIPIYAKVDRVVDLETNQILAESWAGLYLPLLTRLTASPRFFQPMLGIGTAPPTWHPVKILIPIKASSNSED
jgi:hypothetical protein